ncbi:MAG: hypothetical protein KJ583_01970 [Nanoarchaeota archaeon]|nr:hypothetical protein [Nanoarchaeota archaeon]MBU1269028.1 hypothetical protein [Nanoarchaeota archaeon]MBU1604060.1 hypothetical protein [Nanoarchaeota archaeon]MBU2443690.1 hypothetical protein [Nanoarchaeota archaeon]
MSLWKSKSFRLFLTFLIIYSVFANIDGWNENSRLDLTRAIVDEGTFKIDKYANNTGDRAFYNGHYYSDKFPGSSFIAVPFYFVYKYTFGTPDISTGLFELNSDPAYFFMVFFIIMFTSALFSALTVVLIFKISRYFTNILLHRYLVAFAYGLGTIAFSQATFFMGHAIATFFAFASFYLIFKMRQEKIGDYYFLSGFLGGLAFLVDIYALAVVFISLILVLVTKKFNLIFKFLCGFAVFVFVLFLYNYACFDNPLSFSYQNVEGINFGPWYNGIAVYSNCHFYGNDFPIIVRYFGKNRCHGVIESYYLLDYNILLNETINGLITKEVVEIKFGNDGLVEYWITKNYLYSDNFSKIFYTKTTGNYLVYIQSGSFWNLVGNISSKDNYIYEHNMDSNFVTRSDCPFWPNNQVNNTFSCTITDYSENMRGIFFKIDISGTMSVSDSRATKYSSEIIKSYSDVTSHMKHHNHTFNIILRLLFYPYRGLFFFSPILLVSLFGIWHMFRRFKLETLLIVFSTAVVLVFHSFNKFWWSGSSFGPRHLLILVPFLILPLMFVLKKKKIVFFFFFLSIIISFVGLQILEQTVIVVGEHISISSEYNNNFVTFKLIGNPLFIHYFPLFLENGPRSVVLEGLMQRTFFPFLNVFVLLVVIFLLWSHYFFRKYI